MLSERHVRIHVLCLQHTNFLRYLMSSDRMQILDRMSRLGECEGLGNVFMQFDLLQRPVMLFSHGWWSGKTRTMTDALRSRFGLYINLGPRSGGYPGRTDKIADWVEDCLYCDGSNSKKNAQLFIIACVESLRKWIDATTKKLKYKHAIREWNAFRSSDSFWVSILESINKLRSESVSVETSLESSMDNLATLITKNWGSDMIGSHKDPVIGFVIVFDDVTEDDRLVSIRKVLDAPQQGQVRTAVALVGNFRPSGGVIDPDSENSTAYDYIEDIGVRAVVSHVPHTKLFNILFPRFYSRYGRPSLHTFFLAVRDGKQKEKYYVSDDQEISEKLRDLIINRFNYKIPGKSDEESERLSCLSTLCSVAHIVFNNNANVIYELVTHKVQLPNSNMYYLDVKPAVEPFVAVTAKYNIEKNIGWTKILKAVTNEPDVDSSGNISLLGRILLIKCMDKLQADSQSVRDLKAFIKSKGKNCEEFITFPVSVEEFLRRFLGDTCFAQIDRHSHNGITEPSISDIFSDFYVRFAYFALDECELGAPHLLQAFASGTAFSTANPQANISIPLALLDTNAALNTRVCVEMIKRFVVMTTLSQGPNHLDHCSEVMEYEIDVKKEPDHRIHILMVIDFAPATEVSVERLRLSDPQTVGIAVKGLRASHFIDDASCDEIFNKLVRWTPTNIAIRY